MLENKTRLIGDWDKIKENIDKNHKQDLLINENRIRMNFLEKEIDKNKSN